MGYDPLDADRTNLAKRISRVDESLLLLPQPPQLRDACIPRPARKKIANLAACNRPANRAKRIAFLNTNVTWKHTRFTLLVILLGGLIFPSGCSTFRPFSKLPEYDAAKRSVESYENENGDWVRPEGLKGEKRAKSPVSSSLAWIPGMAPKEADKEASRAAFLEGDTLFKKASTAEGEERRDLFRKAVKKFKKAANEWPSSAMEQDALMMAGESAFFAEDFPDAEEYYVKLVKDYPRTMYLDKADQRRMEIALYWLQYDATNHQEFWKINFTDHRLPWNDTDGHGERVLEKMRLDNPTGKLADDVNMELATNAFRHGKYQEARDLFEDLRITYPDSPHQFDSHFLGLKASLETYKGAQYPQEPLDEAEKLIKQIVKQFPNQSKEHQEFLNRAYAEIRYKKAERLQDQANFRIKRGENNSAQFYLDQLLTEFSDTPFAETARTEKERISQLPGEPQRYFQWLNKLFPENSKTKPLLDSKEDNYGS
jgi:outer membrane protein assembly factor BamD (BamD/ComL family)